MPTPRTANEVPPAVREVDNKAGESARSRASNKARPLPSLRRKSQGSSTSANPAKAGIQRAAASDVPNTWKIQPVSV
jgi:hypothetical protein